MSNVLHKTAEPVDYRQSVHTPDFPSATWFIDPDISAVAAVPTKHWKRPLTDPVVEMSAGEKAAADAAEAAAQTAANRAEAVASVDAAQAIAQEHRALLQNANQRNNYNTNRIAELQAALDAMKATSGSADNMRAAIPASWLPTDTRDLPAAVQDYKDDINAGTADP